MTNKNLKLAAMSVALTACVAAQPLVAHAVDAPAEPESKDPDPKAALEEGADLKGQEENAPEGKDLAQETPEDQVEAPVNQEADKKEQEPAFAPDTESKDVEIDYKDPQPDPKDPDTTITEGAVIDTSKKDEESGKTGKIGEATKTETVDPDASTTEVEMGKTTTHPDGSTTTPGTQTTTDQGSGEAKAETETETQETGDKEKDPEKGQIDLNEELGEDRSKLTWDGVDAEAGKDQEEKAKYNGYTIQESKPSEDGNSKELTLKKTETGEEKHLSAEDIAKLMDESEHLDKKEDGSYTLKKTEDILDEEGKVIGTRTTVYQITRDSVQTTTETTLKIRMDKGTKKDSVKLDTPIQQPDIKDEETEKVLLPSGKLENILQDPTTVKKDDGTYIYTETIPNEDGITIREYTITKTDEARNLTYQELADRLGEDFTGDQDGVYYKGEKLTVEQMEAKRHALRYQVQIKETHKTFDQVSGKDEAETAAKTEAIKGALQGAAGKYGIDLTKDELKGIDPTGGDLVVTRDGKKYTFHYTEAGVEYSAPIATDDTTVDGKDAEDVKETTVTGTAYVTSGTISWSKKGEDGTYTASGTLKPGDHHIASKPEIPTGDNVVKSFTNDAIIYTVTTKNDDGSITETIYTFKEAFVSLTPSEKEKAAWDALAKAENKTVQQLKAEGYTISDIKFDSITKSTWTVETRTRSTQEKDESLKQKILVAEGDPTWTLEGSTLKIKGGDTYTGLKQNSDGTYTATQKDGDKTITYTFTLGEVKDLDEPTIKAMLAKEFQVSVDAIELKDGHATYKDGETTVTIDYRNLSKKTLKIDKSVSEAVSVTDTIKDGDKAALEAAQDRLYEALKEKVKSIKLQEGEELWIGDLQITDIDKQKTEIIKHFTTAVSHENMSQQALIAALNAQADEAKLKKVTVNEGTKYQEELPNYYSGEKKNFEHKPAKPPKYRDLAERDDIRHLDLASGAKMDKLPDKDGNVIQTDCVLLAKGQKLEWNYDAGKLLADQSTLKDSDKNHTVGLEKHISKDTEDGHGYHYEYNRSEDNNNPQKSAFYKLTGTVAYDALKNGDDIIEYTSREKAIKAYREATGKTSDDISDAEILGTYVVPIGTGRSKVYQVYTKTAEMTSYGYMTRDANTCVNSTFGRQYDSWDNPEHYKNWNYIGGYDLMISDLVQVSEGKVVGQTQSSIKTLWAPLAIRSTQSLENKSLQLDTKHTSTPVTKTENLGSGYEEKGSFTYDVSYEHTDTYTDNCSQGVKGTGTDKYKTFTQLLKKAFSGKGETSYDTGSISYTYRTTDKVDTTALTKDTKNTTTAKAAYNFITVARKNFTVTTPADPEEPTPPQEEEVETPETPETPQTPELPPVQDATPDDAAPETPVLPSDAVLPAVQDALPQTGVNWMAALGMAFSGMLLTIAGAFASLKYKEKH